MAEFRDPIHPGLVRTDGIHRGGDKPAHTVINGENFHVLKALTWTHRLCASKVVPNSAARG